MNKKVLKNSKFIMVCIFVLTFVMLGASTVYAGETSGKCVEMTPASNVSIHKSWTITFSKKVKFDDIKEVVIEKDGKFVPIRIELENNKAIITPSTQYEENAKYNLKVALNNGKIYSKSFTTSSNTNTSGSTDNGSTEPPAQQQKGYTGSQVKQKLYGLGFFGSNNGGVIYNPNGKNGDDASDYATLMVNGGEWDMTMTITGSDPAFDQKLKTIFGYILPSSGGRLYSIIDNAGVKSQSLTLDGRKVQIGIYSWGIVIRFGPIIK